MSFFCLLQELYKYFVKGQSPGDPYVDKLPFNLHDRFNSTTITGRANIAKATMAFVSVATLGAYFIAPSVVQAVSSPPSHKHDKKEEDKTTSSDEV